MAPGQKFFFIHVMKTGGGTLRRHLQANFERGEVYPGRADQNKRQANTSLEYLTSLSPQRMEQIKVFSGHFPYLAVNLLGGEFTTLTILRDPVERTLSFLRSRQQEQGGKLEAIYEEPFTFQGRILNHQTKVFSLTEIDHPDSYLKNLDVNRERLELAKANLERIDVIGTQERFGDFCAELSERFGWRFGAVEPKNVSPQVEPVPDSFRRRIAADNQADLEFYEYARHLSDARRTPA
jgi:Sulfotransferase family